MDFGVGQASKGWGNEGAGFWYGLPVRKTGRPIRDRGLRASPLAGMRTGLVVAVDWLPDVSWKVGIRRPGP